MRTLVRNLLMLAAVLSVSVNAFAYGFEVDGIYYDILSVQDKTVRVTYKEYSNATYKSDYSGDMVIPEQVQYNEELYSVNSIGLYAFVGCDGLTSITIPISVTTIEGDAFYNCENLESVYISDLSAWCKIDFAENDSNPLKSILPRMIQIPCIMLTICTLMEGY